MRGSVSTPDTEPLTPEYENNYFSHFFESNLDSSSQSAANDAQLDREHIPVFLQNNSFGAKMLIIIIISHWRLEQTPCSYV
ncbi:hypothetical protein LSTR_LSTR014385 [Laodelphax striatellus]|uniref:Uncharacterized protein n=1 Tax=Laodelphax striatellus TaxID=195883 RepID=A0A482WSY7_LAOST|nr:hypothetical protein LSTR_LSTR014385 [Laodelphax striatellus]